MQASIVLNGSSITRASPNTVPAMCGLAAGARCCGGIQRSSTTSFTIFFSQEGSRCATSRPDELDIETSCSTVRSAGGRTGHDEDVLLDPAGTPRNQRCGYLLCAIVLRETSLLSCQRKRLWQTLFRNLTFHFRLAAC